MIVRSAFRLAGGLGRHLLRKDTNERVDMRLDLARNAPADLKDALTVFTAIARTNVRAKREIVHFKMSPAHPLTEEELLSSLKVIEEEHGIPDSMPRYIVAHLKGERAQHFHVVYPLVDPATGRAIKSNDNYLRDEIASRRLELMFAERIVPGPRQTEVIADLTRRGMDDAAQALGGVASIEPGQRIDGATRQQADRLAVDTGAISELAYQTWTETNRDWIAFERAMDKRGFAVARGNKALLLVHNETGFHAPLARLLRQAAKAANSPIKLKEAELSDAFPAARPLDAVRDQGLKLALGNAHAAVDQELGRMVLEAETDEQDALAAKLKKARERANEQRGLEFRATLKARREEIRALYRRRDRIRRARVNRAFVAARWFDTPGTRRRAFILAGTGVLLAGGGLGLAFVVAGLAMSMLPSHERARTLACQARLERQGDWAKLAKDLKPVYQILKAESRQPRAFVDFNKIPKAKRIIAGKLAWEAIETLGPNQYAHPPAEIEIYRRAMGSNLAREIENNVIHGSGRGALILLRWYRPNDPRHGSVLEAAVRATSATTPGQDKAARPDHSRPKPAQREKAAPDKAWER